MGLVLLVANLIHGLVALMWIWGLRRLAGPISAGLWADLLVVALVAPVVVAAARVIGVPIFPETFTLVRADLWTEALLRAGFPWTGVLLVLLAGTTFIFVVQGALPAWRRRRGRLSSHRSRDERLEASLQRVLAGFGGLGMRARRRRRPHVLRLETDRLIAALHGVLEPKVLVSRGLLAKLDDDELDAVIAHEIAHLVRGGNLGELMIWILRALQAPSPAALIIFRAFYEAHEAACDAIAARVTGRPMAVAAALLKVHGRRRLPRPNRASGLKRARMEVLRRADDTATRLRVRKLLDLEPSGLTSRALFWSTALVLGTMLWAIA